VYGDFSFEVRAERFGGEGCGKEENATVFLARGAFLSARVSI